MKIQGTTAKQDCKERETESSIKRKRYRAESCKEEERSIRGVVRMMYQRLKALTKLVLKLQSQIKIQARG